MAKKSFVVAVLLTVFALANGKSIEFNPKIVGGTDAPDGAYPYQISLQYLNQHNCGGSIISRDWILTAAHCVSWTPPSTLTVVSGTNKLDQGGTTRSVLEVHIHERYDQNQIKNDVAVLKVEPITFSNLTSLIALETEELGENVACTVTGWGLTSMPGSIPNEMQQLNVTTVTLEECRKHFGNDAVADNEICALSRIGEGACTSDSGGPLVSNGKQIGVVSFGRPCGIGAPDVYAKVSSFINWIKEKCGNCV